MAEGRDVGHFMRVALDAAELPGQAGNALHALLRAGLDPALATPERNTESPSSRAVGAL